MIKRIIGHIPNAITCCNLLSGCMAVVFAFGGNVRAAFFWIVAGAAFDFCDGMSARLLHAYSPVGKELDSLADLVTFGLAPAFLCRNVLQGIEWSCCSLFMPYTAFIITVASALRLAKFNIDTRQTTSFLGLAVPADALFWCGVTLWLQGISSPIAGYALLACMLVMSGLMVSEIPMFSLKFKNLTLRDNLIRYIFLAGAAFCIIIAGLKGTALAIVFYILLSLLSCRKK